MFILGNSLNINASFEFTDLYSSLSKYGKEHGWKWFKHAKQKTKQKTKNKTKQIDIITWNKATCFMTQAQPSM